MKVLLGLSCYLAARLLLLPLLIPKYLRRTLCGQSWRVVLLRAIPTYRDRGLVWVLANELGECRTARWYCQQDPGRRPLLRTAPYDSLFCAGLFLLCARPQEIVFVDLCTHRVLAALAQLFKIPTRVIHASLSESQASRFLRALDSRWRFGLIDHYEAQTPAVARRLCALGVSRSAVSVRPVLPVVRETEDLREAWKARLNLIPGERLVIAGCTYPEEEPLLIDAFNSLNDPSVRLLIAPRRLNRRLPHQARLSQGPSSERILVLDAYGELDSAYCVASAAYIGGSLFAGEGGHSPLEAHAHHVPVIMGSHYERHEHAVQLLTELGTLYVVNDAQELVSALRECLSSA